MAAPQRTDIQYNVVYRRAEFASRPPSWSSPLPSIEIIGDGDVFIYGSNLPRQVDEELYTPPIDDTIVDIQDKMTLLTTINSCGKDGYFHDACMCSVWIAFVWDETSSDSPPILRDACLLDWELHTRRFKLNC